LTPLERLIFAKFITKKWAVLASKIDKLFIVIGIILKIIKKQNNGSRYSAFGFNDLNKKKYFS